MAQVYTGVVKTPPISLDFNDLYPKILGLIAKVSEQSVMLKTYQYTTSQILNQVLPLFQIHQLNYKQ